MDATNKIWVIVGLIHVEDAYQNWKAHSLHRCLKMRFLHFPTSCSIYHQLQSTKPKYLSIAHNATYKYLPTIT